MTDRVEALIDLLDQKAEGAMQALEQARVRIASLEADNQALRQALAERAEQHAQPVTASAPSATGAAPTAQDQAALTTLGSNIPAEATSAAQVDANSAEPGVADASDDHGQPVAAGEQVSAPEALAAALVEGASVAEHPLADAAESAPGAGSMVEAPAVTAQAASEEPSEQQIPPEGVGASESGAGHAAVEDADAGPASKGTPPSPQALLTQWYERYPKAFFTAHTRPLKVGIHKDLIAREPWSAKLIRRALANYVNLPRYLKSVRVGVERVDLDGAPAGSINEQDVSHAREQLDSLHKRRQQREERQTAERMSRKLAELSARLGH